MGGGENPTYSLLFSKMFYSCIIILVRTGNVCMKHVLYIAEVSAFVVVLCAGGSPLIVPLSNLAPAALYRVSIRLVPITGCVVSRQRVVDFQLP